MAASRLPDWSDHRRLAMARLLLAHGRLEQVGAVIHVKVEHLEDSSELLSELGNLVEPKV